MAAVLEEHADARTQRDEDAEIDQYSARGQIFGCRLPYRGEIAIDQAHDSERDHGRSKDRVTDACDAHPAFSN